MQLYVHESAGYLSGNQITGVTFIVQQFLIDIDLIFAPIVLIWVPSLTPQND